MNLLLKALARNLEGHRQRTEYTFASYNRGYMALVLGFFFVLANRFGVERVEVDRR